MNQKETTKAFLTWRACIKDNKDIKDAGLITAAEFEQYIGLSTFTMLTINIAENKSSRKIQKHIEKLFIKIGKKGFSEQSLAEYKKGKLLKYYKNYHFSKAAYDIGRAGLVLGNYRQYNQRFEGLNNLTNDKIKEVINQYLVGRPYVGLDFRLGKLKIYSPLIALSMKLFSKMMTAGMRAGINSDYE